ncbi:sporulation protein YhbH [Paenibacillus hunanensis]|uniref:Sporulation protein YhbH n=1 Tax=Paenibacillus hunanensis TaxID=539262 RepID=A0ABU1J2U2_9BACL|nr:sporulation protein YhbH [Paenibacillus hunanensis]MDR6244917.1 sporulation protein YhbH [Paenibacillus hunanensis]GGJ05094.1 sporulation protein YhbH [Paenibacillus hunanensis]
MDNRSFIIARDDWSLHRKGEIDQERHKRKVKEAIRENLADLVSEESIIMPQGDKIIKVPIRSLDEPRFRYNTSDEPQVGQGQGGTQVGDVVGQADGNGQSAAGTGPGKGGREAGEQPGIDYYEAELTVDELAELVFEDLKLPHLKPKTAQEMLVDDIRFNDVRKQGMVSNIDKRRTLFEAIKRQALGGSLHGGAYPAAMQQGGGIPVGIPGPDTAPAPVLGPIIGDDVRYKTWEDIHKPQSSAVVLAMMDTSGSMGTFEKYIARSFFFWMVRFLRTRYENVNIRFLAHTTEAKEVDEEAFFHKGESGGTRCSSVYELALQMIEKEYPPSSFNTYAFHFSDGDNLSSDNPETMRLARTLLEQVNMLGYGEIRQRTYGYSSKQLWDVLKRLESPTFVQALLEQKEDVFKTLKAFFGDEMAS